MSSVNGLRTEATVFGNYRVVRRVGSGGMASVYEAVHPGLYRRRHGNVDLSTLTGPGFGYRVEEIGRELGAPVLGV